MKLLLLGCEIMKPRAALLNSQLCDIQTLLERLSTRLKIFHLGQKVLKHTIYDDIIIYEIGKLIRCPLDRKLLSCQVAPSCGIMTWKVSNRLWSVTTDVQVLTCRLVSLLCRLAIIFFQSSLAVFIFTRTASTLSLAAILEMSSPFMTTPLTFDCPSSLSLRNSWREKKRWDDNSSL